MKKTIEEATKIAVELSEHLDAKEQAFFIAGFQECIKWQSEQMYSEEEVEYKVTKVILFERKDGMYQDGNGNQITTEFILQHKHQIFENDGIIYLES